VEHTESDWDETVLNWNVPESVEWFKQGTLPTLYNLRFSRR
jgi:hypothetical protein